MLEVADSLLQHHETRQHQMKGALHVAPVTCGRPVREDRAGRRVGFDQTGEAAPLTRWPHISARPGSYSP